jgi:glycerophosphoryl diester phosphodiesterase
MEGDPNGPARWPYPSWIAHRGGGHLAPENTLAAMAAGTGRGFRMVEFDVKLSADGVPLLMHDATLERTTSGSGSVASRSMQELAALDAGAWFGKRHAGEPIPTLESVARWLIRHDIAANIEIKPGGGHGAMRARVAASPDAMGVPDAETGRVVAQAAAMLWRSAPIPPLLSSFSTVALESARIAAPSLPRAWLLNHVQNDCGEVAAQLGCIAIGVHHASLTAHAVRTAHEKGLAVFAFTVNDAATAARLRRWGVDALITDALDVLGP